MIEKTDTVSKASSVANIVFIVAAWILGAGIQWGVMKAGQEETERRIKALEENTVGRREYEVQQKDIHDRLERIENKLDRNFRSGGKL